MQRGAVRCGPVRVVNVWCIPCTHNVYFGAQRQARQNKGETPKEETRQTGIRWTAAAGEIMHSEEQGNMILWFIVDVLHMGLYMYVPYLYSAYILTVYTRHGK